MKALTACALLLFSCAICAVSFCSGQILFGSYTPATTDKDTPSAFLAMQDWVSAKGNQQQQSIRVVDIGWAADFNVKEIEDLANSWRFDGAIPLINFMPYPYASWSAPNPDAMIAAGGYDDYLDGFFSNLRDVFAVPKYAPGATPLRRRAYLAFAPQPNGEWAPWSAICPPCSSTGQSIKQTAADYVNMFNYVIKKMRQPQYNLPADVIQVVFIASAVDQSASMESYYPNPSLVDWVGVAGDNFGTSLPGNSWVGAQNLFGPMMARLAAVAGESVPKMIACGASTTTPNGVTAKNSWIQDMYQYAIDAQLRLVAYYNADTSTDFAAFGGADGADQWSSPVSNFTYNVYPAMRDAVSQAPFVGCNISNPRYVTNKIFFGL